MPLLPPPGPERNRQFLLLGVLVAVLAFYDWYQGWYPFDSGTAVTPAATSKEQTRLADRDALALPEPMKLEELAAAPENKPTSRNPFRYGQKPLPPAPPVVQQPYVPPPPPPPPPPVVPSGPPPIALRMIGVEMVIDTKQWLASIQDPDTSQMVWAKDGERVFGKYRVVKVSADSMVVQYLDGTGTVTRRLER